MDPLIVERRRLHHAHTGLACHGPSERTTARSISLSAVHPRPMAHRGWRVATVKVDRGIVAYFHGRQGWAHHLRCLGGSSLFRGSRGCFARVAAKRVRAMVLRRQASLGSFASSYVCSICVAMMLNFCGRLGRPQDMVVQRRLELVPCQRNSDDLVRMLQLEICVAMYVRAEFTDVFRQRRTLRLVVNSMSNRALVLSINVQVCRVIGPLVDGSFAYCLRRAVQFHPMVDASVSLPRWACPPLSRA